MEKLVRDRVIFHMTAQNGESPKFRVIHNCDDLKPFVVAKVREEIEELLAAVKVGHKNKITEEFADVYEILSELAKITRIEHSSIVTEMNTKRNVNGGFDESIILTIEENTKNN